MSEISKIFDILYEADQKLSAATKRKVLFQTCLMIGSIAWVPMAALYISKRLKTSKSKAISLVLMVVAIISPIPKSALYKYSSSIWDSLFSYFKLRVVGHPTVSNNLSVFGVFPHGIIPVSLGLTNFGEINKLFFKNLHIVTATATRLLPIFSLLLRLGGTVDASVGNVEAALSDGVSIGVAPGGIAEMYLGYPQRNCLPDCEYAVLKSRKGFIRAACKAGADIIPVFAFGASKIYKHIILPPLIEDFSRWMKASLVLFYGDQFSAGQEGGILNKTIEFVFKWIPIMPFATRLTYGIGSAIVTNGLNTHPDTINFVHNIFIQELQRTFDTYKHSHTDAATGINWAHKSLVIM